jgi:hypothetical protein
VEVNVRDGGLEKFSDLGLREPDGFIVKPTLDAGAAALGLVENDLPTLRDGRR